MEMWPRNKRLPDRYSRIVPGHRNGANHMSITYRSWYCMLLRTVDQFRKREKDKAYYTSGIQCCIRWIEGDGVKPGFLCFLEDMGERPSREHTLSRKGDIGNYEPGNVVWEIQPTTRKKRAA